MAKKKTPKHSKKKKYQGTIISVLVVIIVIAVLYFVVSRVGIPPYEEVVATVNGEKITMQELAQKYESLPEQYKLVITKDLLLEQMINTKLLVQEAQTRGIEVSDEEIDAEIDRIKMQSFNSDYEFQQFLKENNIKLEGLKNQAHEQLMINRLLELEILSKIDVSESRVRSFYNKNKELLGNASYDSVKEQVKQSIIEDMSASAVETYIGQLKVGAEITKKGEFAEETTTEKEIKTFTGTYDKICMKDDKPIIRFYTTSNCQPCDWIKDVFYSAVGNYHEENKITIYHWELDTGDNLMTAEIEEGIPKEELQLFKKYNPKSTVPTYVFGCRYVRAGNGYDNLEQEKEEFEAVVDKLLE